MATATISSIASAIGDGTKNVIVKSPKAFQYGYGASPTEWYTYTDYLTPVEFGTVYGAVKIRTDDVPFTIQYTVGV